MPNKGDGELSGAVIYAGRPALGRVPMRPCHRIERAHKPAASVFGCAAVHGPTSAITRSQVGRQIRPNGSFPLRAQRRSTDAFAISTSSAQ